MEYSVVFISEEGEGILTQKVLLVSGHIDLTKNTLSKQIINYGLEYGGVLGIVNYEVFNIVVEDKSITKQEIGTNMLSLARKGVLHIKRIKQYDVVLSDYVREDICDNLEIIELEID